MQQKITCEQRWRIWCSLSNYQLTVSIYIIFSVIIQFAFILQISIFTLMAWYLWHDYLTNRPNLLEWRRKIYSVIIFFAYAIWLRSLDVWILQGHFTLSVSRVFALKLGNGMNWQVGSRGEFQIFPINIIYLREVPINHFIRDTL